MLPNQEQSIEMRIEILKNEKDLEERMSEIKGEHNLPDTHFLRENVLSSRENDEFDKIKHFPSDKSTPIPLFISLL